MLKPLLRGALAFALVLTGALPAPAQQVWKWSTTSASNSNADSAINWATGMAPSAVSPSARAMMAAVAKYRDDIGGRLTTGGTSTAYTLTSNSSLAATPNNGQLVCFTVNATNGASSTLAVDGGTAFPIRVDATNAVPASTLVSGSPYCAVFNSTASAWILHGYFGSPTTIPLAGIIDYAGSTAPNSNFALAYGQAISRTTYAGLFAITGTTFGVGDGSTTFNLPDLRGRLVAGVDNMGGSAASRITVAGGNFDGTALGGTGGLQNHTLLTAEIPSHTHTGTSDATTVSGTTASSGTLTVTGTTDGQSADHSHTVTVQTFNLLYAAGANPVSVFGSGSGTTFNTGGVNVGHTHTFTGTGGSHTHTFNAGSHTHTFTSAATGGGGAHTILPPVMTLSKIIRIF